MKNILWVYRSFGFRAAIYYIRDCIWVSACRLSDEDIPVMFEELSDKEAEQVAFAFGLYKWNYRDDLNRQWCELESRMR